MGGRYPPGTSFFCKVLRTIGCEWDAIGYGYGYGYGYGVVVSEILRSWLVISDRRVRPEAVRPSKHIALAAKIPAPVFFNGAFCPFASGPRSPAGEWVRLDDRSRLTHSILIHCEAPFIGLPSFSLSCKQRSCRGGELYNVGRSPRVSGSRERVSAILPPSV